MNDFLKVGASALGFGLRQFTHLAASSPTVPGVASYFVRAFADFASTLERATGLVRIGTSSGGLALLHTDDVRRATPRILARYQIPRSSSLTPP